MTDSNSAEFERLHLLVTSQLEGELSDEDQRELSGLLRDNESAQQIYVEMMEDATSLRWWCTDVDPTPQLLSIADQTIESRRRRLSRRWIGLATLAASLLLALALGFLVLNGRQPRLATVDPPPNGAPGIAADSKRGPLAGIATLTRLRGVRWSDHTKALPELSRLAVGQNVEIENGEAEIIFDQAVHLVVRGPASIDFRSPMEIYSPYGVIAASVGESGKGFVIETPNGRITDLGTEFGVAIAKQGTTDVAVFRGSVDLAYGLQALSVNTRLMQGQGLHLDAQGNLQRLVSIDNSRFPSVYGGPRSKANGSSIFLDVHDNIRDPVGAKFYRIVPGGLGEDALAYVDRQHEWNGIDEKGMPEFLLGADLVLPFNEDKYVKSLEVTLTIGRPATLFVFLSRKAQVPEWLSKDFVNTGLEIGLDESGEFTNGKYRLGVGPGDQVNTRFAIWKRDVPSAAAITLGGVRPRPEPGWGYCMYGIAAIPLDVPQTP